MEIRDDGVEKIIIAKSDMPTINLETCPPPQGNKGSFQCIKRLSNKIVFC
jgi:hypothetical protein